MKNKLFVVLIIASMFAARFVLAQNENGGPDEENNLQPGQNEPAKPTTPQTSTAQAESKNISGPTDKNKISLDIRGMDIVDILKTLATRTGMNIVVGKNVTGRVTLFLKNVDVWDAFEIILLANDLAYETKGDIVNVMTQRDYELLHGERYKDNKRAKIIQLKYAKAADLSKALNQIKSNIGRIVIDEGSNTLVLIDTPEKLMDMLDFIKNTDLPIQTKVYKLNYALADKLQAKIQEAITKGIGYVRIDERTNKIAVTDYPSKLAEIEKIVAAFDEKTPQVLIDAQIIEVNPSDKFEMGVDWEYWIEKYFKISTNLPMGTTGRLIMGTANTTPTGKGEYKAIIDALRTVGETKILSSPRILTLNNQEAKILVGTKEAYITSATSQSGTGTTVTSDTVNFVDVGIKLYVTPTINGDGFVTMKIKPEVSSAETQTLISQDKKTEVPIVTTSESETSVLVKDGITLIIGGLRKDQRTKTVKKVPLFADIPVLGFFMRSTSDEMKTTELIILLTPHIMSGESSFSDFADIAPKDGAIVTMEGGNIRLDKISPLPAGQELLTDSDYNKLVAEKVKALSLFTPSQGDKGQVGVSFVINADGRLKYEPRIISSSNQNLNNLAIECIKSASPFPALPKGLNKREETFQITLEYK